MLLTEAKIFCFCSNVFITSSFHDPRKMSDSPTAKCPDLPLWKIELYSIWNRYYFSLNKEKTTDLIDDQLRFIRPFQNESTLFAGFIKSGNTWLRFLIYNYFNILNNNTEETLSYSELNQIQSNALGDPVPFCKPQPNLPYITRTHRHYSKALAVFNRGIYC